MRMKHITAPTMQEALAQARKELGDDAVLLETKKLRGNQGVTVVFAVEAQDDLDWFDAPDAGIHEEAAKIPLPAGEGGAHASGRVSASSPTASPRIVPPTPASREVAPTLALLHEILAYHRIPEGLEATLLGTIQANLPRAAHPNAPMLETAEALLAQALSDHVAFTPIRTGDLLPPARGLMLIGPHGVGKTSAIAKLATELTLHKRKVVIISTDIERLGATETLQGLADILGCGFHVTDHRAELKELLKDYAGEAWVLVDSAGVNIYEFQQLKALGELASLHGVEPILTCPAGMDPAEAQEMAGVFSFLPIERMLITRVDATRRLTSLFAALTTGGYGLANMSQSASPSEACLPVSPHALARLMLRHLRERMQGG